MKIAFDDMPSWVRGSHQLQMGEILTHPRLVFEEVGLQEIMLLSYYLRRGKPFTVVVKR